MRPHLCPRKIRVTFRTPCAIGVCWPGSSRVAGTAQPGGGEKMLPRCERDTGAFEAVLAAERARLVRLCARITGDADAAEDLAQETLVEAWRALGRLRDPDGLSPWLAAIARNVCLRWARGRGRELSQRTEIAAGPNGLPLALDDLPDGDEDIAVDLERGELTELLDRALALL